LVAPDTVAFFLEHLPDDEIRSLRDRIAEAETGITGPMWEHRQKQSKLINQLKERCAQGSHALIIVLAGKLGTRRRLMRNGWNERRTCLMCGTEEEGTLATGFLARFLWRKAVWKFTKLNRYAARTFTDPEWYFETCGIVRNFSFSTEVVVQHAFPPRLTVPAAWRSLQPRDR
jgi:hypothetical protein